MCRDGQIVGKTMVIGSGHPVHNGTLGHKFTLEYSVAGQLLHFSPSDCLCVCDVCVEMVRYICSW